MSGDETGLLRAISVAVEDASAKRPVTVLDLGAAGPVTFQVRFDEIGVPSIARSRPVTWESVDSGASVPVPSGDLIIVSSATDISSAPRALTRLRGARPDALAWEVPGTSVGDLLIEAVSNSPIRQDYELLVAQAHPGSNRIRLTSEPLFAAGARRGDVASLDVRCEQDGDRRIGLAVVARDGPTPHLLSAGQVPLTPGRHRIHVELAGPGVVRFIEPEGVATYSGSLSDLTAAIPEYLNSVKHARLILAIEISGQASRVASRLYRAEQLLKSLHRQLPEPGQLLIGIVGYGAHRFERKRSDERVIVTDWMSAPESALESLGRLGAADIGYPEAVQVEDMLADVVKRLSAMQQSRPTALLLFGDRPPHPSQPGNGLLPCPHGYDWQKSLNSLRLRPDIVVVAIRDDLAAPGTAAWAQLGATMLLALDSFDNDTLGRKIGFVVPSLRNIPIPIID